MGSIERKIQAVFNHLNGDVSPKAVFLFNRDRVDKNFLYITELENGVFENCGVLFDKSGKMYLFTSTLEEEAARAAEGYAEIVIYKNEGERNERLSGILSGYGKIGLCFGGISHSFFLFLARNIPGVEWVDAGCALKRARMIKTRDEIDRIAEACRITSRVADDIPGVLRRGMTELELSAEIDYMLKKRGAEGPAFKTIAAFSSNTSMPHYSSGQAMLADGDVVLVDFGAEYGGYASDITQTYLTGNPSKELLDLYATVLAAQRLALELIRAGESSERVEGEVRGLIDGHCGYRGRFIHSLGHSIGLDVHDDSYPSKDYGRQFMENMVLTVEPGIYIPGSYGVRLEDDVVVKNDGCLVLTTASKELRTYEIR